MIPEVERDPNWKFKERSRWYDQKKPVWSDEQFWARYMHVHNNQFVHVSDNDPGALVYIQSEDKGERGIRTRIKAGRYLKKYFGDVLTDKEIKMFASWQTNGTLDSQFDNASVWQLQFATESDDIVDVYMHGPKSCMDGQNFNSDDNPVCVYGAGDLAIAYFKKEGEDKVWARALVWPAKKVMGRIYPTPENYYYDGFETGVEAKGCQQALFNRLKAEGYKSQDEGARFNGARMLRIPYRGSDYKVVMPYLDNGYHVNERGDHFVMAKGGEIACDSTDGYVVVEPEYSSHCEHCDDGIRENDSSYTVVTSFTSSGNPRGLETWCECCQENDSFSCAGCDEYVSDNVERIRIGDNNYAREWAVNHGAYRSDYSGDWFFTEIDPPVTTVDGEVRAESEAEMGRQPVTIYDYNQLELEVA